MITKDIAKDLCDYSTRLPNEIEATFMELLKAQDALETGDYGKVADKITNAITMLKLLEHSYPIGLRYLKVCLDIKPSS